MEGVFEKQILLPMKHNSSSLLSLPLLQLIRNTHAVSNQRRQSAQDQENQEVTLTDQVKSDNVFCFFRAGTNTDEIGQAEFCFLGEFNTIVPEYDLAIKQIDRDQEEKS